MQYLRRTYEEVFQAKWRTGIEESVPQGIALKPAPDSKDPNTVMFTPTLGYYDSLNEHQTRKLFEKYGEEAVLALASSLHQSQDAEAYGELVRKLTESEIPHLTISWEVELPAASATVKGPNSIDVDVAPDTTVDRRISEDDMVLWSVIEQVAKRVGLNPNAFFSREHDAARQGSVAASTSLTDFVKLATKTASTPEDFSNIRTITSVRNRILSYRKVSSFIEELVRQTLTRRSVVSFYVNTDVWRLLPLVMENKNWLSLAEDFLKSKH
jgi:hypothetical protein